jgi:predicted permease
MLKRWLYYSKVRKSPPFGLLVVPIAICLVFVPYLAKKHPLLNVIVIVALGIIFVFLSIYGIYGAFITGRYIQKHDFQLWKKSKSSKLRERREAAKEIHATCMRTPHLEKHVRYFNKLAFVLFLIWTLIFVGVYLFAVFSDVETWGIVNH